MGWFDVVGNVRMLLRLGRWYLLWEVVVLGWISYRFGEGV